MTVICKKNEDLEFGIGRQNYKNRYMNITYNFYRLMFLLGKLSALCIGA